MLKNKQSFSSDVDNDQLKITLESISEGNTEGYLWSDGKFYFLWDLGNVVFYLFGESPDSEHLENLTRLYEKEVRGKAESEAFSYFKVNDLTGISEDSVRSVFGLGEYKMLKKYFYRYTKGSVKGFESSVDELEIVDIDEDLLESKELKNFELIKNEIEWMWPSLERYFQKGYGKASLIDDEIVCWCTAEYVSEGRCGIGIETLEGFRQKGIATVTAAVFIDHCLKNNVAPYWECGAYNEPSVKLAERLGFHKIDEYQVLLGKF